MESRTHQARIFVPNATDETRWLAFHGQKFNGVPLRIERARNRAGVNHFGVAAEIVEEEENDVEDIDEDDVEDDASVCEKDEDVCDSDNNEDEEDDDAEESGYEVDEESRHEDDKNDIEHRAFGRGK